MTQRIEPVGPRRGVAPVESILLTPVEREAERERRERRRQPHERAAAERPAEPGEGAGLDVRA